MTERLKDIANAIIGLDNSIAIYEKQRSKLYHEAIRECSVEVGEVVTANHGAHHLGKAIQVDTRSFCPPDGHMLAYHWLLEGPVLRADGSRTRRWWGQSIQKID